jgi:hypothetical protein
VKSWWLPVLGVLAVGCGSSGSTSHSTSSTTARLTPTQTQTQSTPTRPQPPAPKPKPRSALPPGNNGSLPQTHQQPSSDTAAFKAEMAALWAGVRSNSLNTALPAFFPETAYAQVKAISDPQGDWQSRLAGNFKLDLAAAHNLLGSGAGGAQLVEVDVPSQYAHWVDPGACYNGLGYWEVPNSRVVYRENGELKSFGIASMISWRGYWYVVHMGSVTGGGGTVDDPESGKGTPAASSTC